MENIKNNAFYKFKRIFLFFKAFFVKMLYINTTNDMCYCSNRAC